MDKLAALRALMKERKVDAYIVTGGDAHGSGWVSGHWSSRKWLTGFTGSAGLVVVTQTEAGLWTDGRYFIQAEGELAGTGFDLYKIGQPNVPTYEEFLLQKFPKGACIGFDGQTMTYASHDKLYKKLNPDHEKENRVQKFSFDNNDLIGSIWFDRPPMPNAPAFEHLPQFAGLSAAEKLRTVREKMREFNLTSYLVTALDSIAWLLNIRGQDFGFPGMPVAYAFALITEQEAFIFINPEKIADISGKLVSQGFSVENYNAVEDKISSLQPGGKIYFNPNTTNVKLYSAIPSEVKQDDEHEDIIIDLKGVKSETELANIRNAFIKEGAAMTKLLKWICDSMASGKTITEDDVANTLIGLRKQQEHYIGDSFPVIAAYGVHGVQPHYRHTGSGAVLQNENFFLLDTGGQYLDGTTDTTRTIALCEPTIEMKRDFTLVLKGHIALNRAIFLKGTTGIALDMLARQPLLQSCQNYNHGTGHGIGYCLGVHEGPHGISPRSKLALKPGMLVSNEPAIYKNGQYGIRTENIVAVKEYCENEFGTFYNFENLTFCPYDTRSINTEMLSPDEKDFVNAYHEEVQKKLAPLLTAEEREWLKNYCAQV